MGCIFAEMLNCTQKQMVNRNNDFKKRFMFKGKSCYPISPYQEDESKKKNEDEILIDRDDQMVKIVNKLKLTSQDLSFLSTEDHIGYVNMLVE